LVVVDAYKYSVGRVYKVRVCWCFLAFYVDDIQLGGLFDIPINFRYSHQLIIVYCEIALKSVSGTNQY